MRFCVILAALVVSCGGAPARRSSDAKSATRAAVEQNVAPSPKSWGYSVVATYPHPTSHYTQGLLWSDGRIIEGTGQYGASGLYIYEPGGKIERSARLGSEYFGEGITLHEGKLYQLTWLEKRGFVYDPATLSPTGSFSYYGEGWGLTSDGEHIYMSDGTHIIRVLDPATFEVSARIHVRFGRRSTQMLNELEWIDGRIWANLYGYNRIVVINPADGQIEAYIDLDELELTQSENPVRDVLNGIAYDAATGRIFVTGKNWDKIFEIKIEKDE
jgi:glutamine cyclotransferase